MYAPSDNDTAALVATTFSLIGKSAITGSFSLVFLYTPEIYPTNYRYTFLLIKKLKLPVLVRLLSAVQPFSHHLTFNFPWSLFWGYIRKLAVGSPLGNNLRSLPGFVYSHHNIKLAQTQPSQGINTHLGGLESQTNFFCPENFTLGQCRIRTQDFSIFSRTRYQWTNAPRTL